MSTQEQMERFDAWLGSYVKETGGRVFPPDALKACWQTAEAAAIERCALIARGYSIQAESIIRALLKNDGGEE